MSGLIPQDLSNLSALRNKDFTSLWYVVLEITKEKVYPMVKGKRWAYKYILSTFTSLDISTNNLSGEIPKVIGYL